MPRTTMIGVALTFASALAWAARLAFGSTPWASDAAALLAATVVVLSVVGAIAALLAPSRWVRNYATTVAAGLAGLALVLRVDVLWAVAMVTGAAGLAILWAAPSDTWFRSSVKPEPVPLPAIWLTLGLMAAPAVIAASAVDSVGTASWMLAAASFALAWAYGRAIAGALWVLRLGYPLLGVAAAIEAGIPHGLAPLVVGVALSALAWTAGARLAAEPLAPTKAESVPILPEMLPPGLLESAGYDQRGRPTERG